MCHCAGWLADSLADNKQVPSDGCRPSWRGGGVCRTTARLQPSYLPTVEKCSVVISLAISELTSLEGRQRRLKARFQAAEPAREIPQVTGFHPANGLLIAGTCCSGMRCAGGRTSRAVSDADMGEAGLRVTRSHRPARPPGLAASLWR